jgi:hypothetical protein
VGAAVIALVLAFMLSLAPGREHSDLGGAIARAVESEPAIFKDDASKTKTAAIMVAVAFRESSLTLGALGDHGQSFCAFQIHRTSGGGPALLTDADACVRKGLAMLRESARVCPKAPVAWYAVGGAGACTNARAIRISNDRMAVAKRLAKVTP